MINEAVRTYQMEMYKVSLFHNRVEIETGCPHLSVWGKNVSSFLLRNIAQVSTGNGGYLTLISVNGSKDNVFVGGRQEAEEWRKVIVDLL